MFFQNNGEVDSDSEKITNITPRVKKINPGFHGAYTCGFSAWLFSGLRESDIGLSLDKIDPSNLFPKINVKNSVIYLFT